MPNSTAQFLNKLNNPIFQGASILAAVLIFNVISWLLNALNLMTADPTNPWLIATAFLLFYAMLNALLSLKANDFEKYWGRSVSCFLGLAAISGLLAYLFSGISLNEAGSFRWIYVVLAVGYIVFLTIMSMMRKIVDFAQKEEWNHPRARKNKKR